MKFTPPPPYPHLLFHVSTDFHTPKRQAHNLFGVWKVCSLSEKQVVSTRIDCNMLIRLLFSTFPHYLERELYIG